MKCFKDTSIAASHTAPGGGRDGAERSVDASIVLVSHSVDEREVYARALRASGYQVVGAATTTLGYQIATTRPTDMVVTEAIPLVR